MPAGRPPLYETPEEMQKVIDLHFAACKINRAEVMGADREELVSGYTEDDLLVINNIDDSHPTVSGLAYTLGMSTEALRNYQEKDEFLVTVKEAKQRIEKYLEQNLYGQAVTGTIFNLKNNFGWKDKTETEHSGAIDLSGKSDAELAAIIDKS